MGKKSGRTNQASSPEMHQMLLASETSTSITHPPNNPYYPDLSSSSPQLSPPSYTESSASLNTNSVPLGYIHQQPAGVSRPITTGTTSVVINQPSCCDHVTAKRHRRMRRFNNEVFLCSIISAIMAIWCYNQYENRGCQYSFVVHKPAPELEITISQVRDFHLVLVYLSIILVVLSMVKCMLGKSKSYSSYKFAMALLSLLGIALTGYITWLAYYSPCSTDLKELASGTIKTGISRFVDTLPSPNKGVFGESNVLNTDGRDIPGQAIFCVDFFNCLLYLCLFLDLMILC